MATDYQAESWALKTTLDSAINIMSAEQREQLLDVIQGTVKDLSALWGRNYSTPILRDNFLNDLEMIEFFLREREDLTITDQAARKELSFVCAKCNAPSTTLDGRTQRPPSCLICESDKWLVPTHR